MKEGPLFTVEDHLRVQQQIEARANELWREGGCADGEALRDWLRAEREVLEQFVLAYDLAQPAGQEQMESRLSKSEPPAKRRHPEAAPEG